VRRISRQLRCRALSAALLLAAGAAHGRPPVEQPDNLLNDEFSLQAAFIRTANTTSLRYDPSTGGTGTNLAVEPELGMPKQKWIGRGELALRIHERHRLRLSTYFVPLDRSGATVLKNSIVFGNTTYNAGEPVQSSLSMRILALSYAYSFVRSDRYEVDGTLGINVLGVEATATAVARLRTESQTNSAPAPVVGIEGTGRLSSRFYVEGRLQYMQVLISDTRGSFKNFEADLLYRMHPNATAGLGYTGFNVGVTSATPGASQNGSFGLRSFGPQLFLRVGF
jgi:hypothetical protein